MVDHMKCKSCKRELVKIQDAWTDEKVQWDHHQRDMMDELWVMHKAESDVGRIGLLE